jgi:hypothetical protein
VDEVQAARIAEAVRRELKRFLEAEFDSLKSAGIAVGVPNTTMWRYFSPDDMTTSKRGVPLTILATVADWLHDERGYPELGILWRETKRKVLSGELD